MSPGAIRRVSLSSPEGSADLPEFGFKETEIEKKRARDRKSQQAMRDRNKWTIQNLTEQVAFLTRSLDEKVHDVSILDARIGFLEAENSQLRTQNAALQLNMLGQSSALSVTSDLSPDAPPVREPWELPPLNSPPSCIADQILQNFITAGRNESAVSSPDSIPEITSQLKPNFTALLQKDGRCDRISNVVGDIVRSYPEISSLPRQAAVFYTMTVLFKWLVHLDEESWQRMPVWLRPIPCQLTTPHAAWIDRIPWPRTREFLIQHPEITLDDFASTYSSSFVIPWDYDPAHILITTFVGTDGARDLALNPIYEEHIRQLKNWTVGDLFRKRFPEIATLIDKDTSRKSPGLL